MWEQVVMLVVVAISGAVPAVLAYRRGEQAAWVAEKNAEALSRQEAKVNGLANGGHDYSLVMGQVGSLQKKVAAMDERITQLEGIVERI